MTLTPLPEPTFLESLNPEMLIALLILLVFLGRDGALLMLRARSFDRASMLRLVAAVPLAALLLFSGRSLPAKMTDQALSRQQPAERGLIVKLPAGGQAELVAANARAQLCLKQAFAFPGQIVIKTTGERSVTFQTPPEVLWTLWKAPVADGSLSYADLPYHTCEVVQGRPTAQVELRAVSQRELPQRTGES